MLDTAVLADMSVVPAAAEQGASTTVPDATDVQGQMQRQLEDMPPAVGLGMAVVGLVYILIGWRLAVFMVMLATAGVLALLGFQGGVALGGGMLTWILAAVGVVVGLLVGRYVHRLGGALYGAVLFGLLGAVPGAVLSIPMLTIGGGLVFGVIGALLGWALARHMDAIGSSLCGAYLIGFGVAALTQGVLPESMVLIAALVAGICALILGIWFQFRDIRAREQAKSGKTSKLSRITGRAAKR